MNEMKKKRCAEDFVTRLKSISKALNKIQSDKCTISNSVLIWQELVDKLYGNRIVMNRNRQAM